MKQFVDVICLNQKTGQIRPLYILWENGIKYPIDKITDNSSCFIKKWGMGLRFTCKIGNNYRYLFLEEGKWFIEKTQLN